MKKLILSFLIFVPILLLGQIINVPADYSTIQQGIDVSVDGDTVLVQPGTYIENITWDAKNITLASLYLTTLDTNYIYQTIIDADSMGTGILITNLTTDARLSGFTIQNGFAPGGPGGGLEMHSASPLITHMIFKDNTASIGGGFFAEISTVFLLNSTFLNNAAENGGGAVYTANCNTVIEDCLFDANGAPGAGAVYIIVQGPNVEAYTAYLRSNTFMNNWAGQFSSGLHIERQGMNALLDVEMMYCDFLNNSTESNGALQIRGGDISFNIENSKFIGNTSNKFTAGAVFVAGCGGELYNCLFANNIAGLSGGQFNSGGVTLWAGTEVFFNNCTFADNQADYGGGMTVGPNSVAFMNHCIFKGNAIDQIALIDYDGEGGTAAIDYCNIEYGMDSIRVDPNSLLMWGDHNISEDPLFEGSGDEPYALSVGSPCIDGGNPDITGASLTPYDILGNVRVWDGDENGSEILDIGAYEYDAPLWVGVPDNPLTKESYEILEKVYPNPCSGIIRLQYNLVKNESAICEIYSLTGQMVCQTVVQNRGEGEMDIDLSSIPSGLYFLRLFNEGHSETVKIIVSNE